MILHFPRALLIAVSVLGGGIALPHRAPGQQPAAPPPVVVDRHGDALPSRATTRLGTMRWRHPEAVTFVGFAAEGKQLVTGCADGLFRVWDAASGKQLRQFGKSAPRRPATAALTPDGTILAAQNPDGSVSLWDVATGAELRALQAPRTLGAVGTAFSPDGTRVAVRQIDGSIRMYSVADGTQMRVVANAPPVPPGDGFRVNGSDPATRMTFTADGNTLTVEAMGLEKGLQRGVLLLHDVANKAPIRMVQGPYNVFNGTAALSADGKQVAWSSPDGQIHLYDVASGKEVKTLGADQNIFQGKLLFAADGKTLISRPVNNKGLNVWDVATGKVARVLAETAGGDTVLPAMVAQAITLDGKTIAEGLTNGCVYLWDVGTGKKLAPQDGHEGRIVSVATQPDGKTLVTIGADQTVRRWDVATGKETGRFRLPSGGRAQLAPNGGVAVLGIPNSVVQLWDTATGKLLHAINVPVEEQFAGYVGTAGGLDITADGKLLAVRGADGITRIYDAQTAKQLTVVDDKAASGGLPALVENRGHVVFSNDGRMLATLSRSPTNVPQIRLWNTQTGKAIARFDANRRIAALAIAPDGRTVASANMHNSVSLWEVLSGKECLTIAFPLNAGGEPAKKGAAIAMMKSPHAPEVYNCALAFAPDGRSLAVTSGDDRVRVLALHAGGEVGVGAGHVGPVPCLAFAPDGKTVYTGGADSTALGWDSRRLLPPAAAPAGPLAAAQVETLWTALAGEPKDAYKAVSTLATAPQQALGLFAARVKPTPGVDRAMVAKLIAGLESDNFDERERASRELEKVGDRAQPALQKLLDSKPALETQQRVDRILEQLTTGPAPSAEVLRNLRAVQLLEQIASPEARQLLRTLAGGAPGDKLTRHAEAALKRLGG